MSGEDAIVRAHDTGAPLQRDVRPFDVGYAGLTRTVDLPGWYPAAGVAGDALHMGADLAAVEHALEELKREARRLKLPDPREEAIARQRAQEQAA